MGSQNFEHLMNVYHGIFVYCGIAAIVFLLAAIALFILLKIPRVFSELTGRVAKKAIEEMSGNGESGGLGSKRIGEDGRRHRKSAKTGTLGTSRLRRKTVITDELGATGKIGESRIAPPPEAQMAAQQMPPDMTPANNIQGSSGYAPTDVPNSYGEAPTDVLSSGDAPTDVLNSYGDAPTDVLNSYGDAPTDVLNNYGDAPTDVLNSYGDAPTDAPNNYGDAPTDSLNNYGDAPTDALNNYGDAPTDALNNYGGAPTETLEQPQNASAGYGGDATAVLNDANNFGETMVLDRHMAAAGFMILRSIVEIHTDEVI